MENCSRARLEQVIKACRPQYEPKADFEAWTRAHPSAIEALRTGPIYKTRWWSRIAAIVVVSLAVGVVLGTFITQTDTDRLRTELAAAIATELQDQLQLYAEQCSAAALTAATKYTQQHVAELANSINAVRLLDRQQILMAIQQIELNRRQDMAVLGSSLYALANINTQVEPSQDH